jgi:DNA-binding Lrp family transcriptional regulator
MARNIELSTVDLAIIRALQHDARITNKDLAARVGIAPSTCLDRVARLRVEGVITGYRIQVDPAMLGRPLQAMLYIQLRPHRRPLVDTFVAHLLALPETRAVYHLTGPDDFLVHVAAADVEALQRFVLDELTAREQVVRVHTNLVFQAWEGGPVLPPDPR